MHSDRSASVCHFAVTIKGPELFEQFQGGLPRDLLRESRHLLIAHEDRLHYTTEYEAIGKDDDVAEYALCFDED